jgi:hypothetical protein
VRDEHAAGQPLVQFLCQVLKARCPRQHFVRDPGERLDLGGHRHARVDERRPLRHYFEPLDLQHPDLGHPVGGRAGTCRLEIDDRERCLEQVHGYIFTILADRDAA